MKKSVSLSIYCVALSCLLVVTLFGNHAISAISENAPIRDRKTVIIDAGHGGVDGGATSCTGVLESQINLQIALRLDDLMHLLGIRTKMIRTTDTSVYTDGNTIAAKKVSDLKNRVRIVNEEENAYLISIHQNYFQESKYSGAQVFYGNLPESKELAGKLQQLLIQTVNPASKRSIKPSKEIYLLDHIQKCGVLIECGFLSNPQEEALLRDPQYQMKLCCVIACAFSQYLHSSDIT